MLFGHGHGGDGGSLPQLRGTSMRGAVFWILHGGLLLLRGDGDNNGEAASLGSAGTTSDGDGLWNWFWIYVRLFDPLGLQP